MSLKGSKLAVLRQLAQEPDPVTLSELLETLGEGFHERSVRRWLSQLIQEGEVQRLGQKRGSKYCLSEPSKREGAPGMGWFSAEASRVIDRIKKPLFERAPVGYIDSWLHAYRPNQDHYLPLKTRKYLLEIGQRTGSCDPAGTYAHQIFNRLLIDLSYNSSRLEGNTYSLLDTERLLLYGDTATGKLDEEKVMILNHKEAIRYLVDNASHLEINRHVMCTLHYLLSDGLVSSEEAGNVRQHGVRIGGSIYIPLEDPRRLELQLEEIAYKASLIRDPFEQSFFLLVHISYLQAFVDVNKRTARLAANISLIKGNLVPLAFNDLPMDAYISAMIAIYELQDVRPLADLFLHSYMRTCSAYNVTVKAMGFDACRVRYRQDRRKVVRTIILECLRDAEMHQYIKKYAAEHIPKEEREDFIQDVLEDIAHIDEIRLVGLGVTPHDLQKWKAKST